MGISQCWKQRSGLGTLRGRPGTWEQWQELTRGHPGCLPHSSTPDFTCVLTAVDAPLAQVRPPELEGGVLQHFQCIGAMDTEAGSWGPCSPCATGAA